MYSDCFRTFFDSANVETNTCAITSLVDTTINMWVTLGIFHYHSQECSHQLQYQKYNLYKLQSPSRHTMLIVLNFDEYSFIGHYVTLTFARDSSTSETVEATFGVFIHADLSDVRPCSL